jgi:hypothetical protein
MKTSEKKIWAVPVFERGFVRGLAEKKAGKCDFEWAGKGVFQVTRIEWSFVSSIKSPSGVIESLFLTFV